MPQLSSLRGFGVSPEDDSTALTSYQPLAQPAPIAADADFTRGLLSSNYSQAANEYYARALEAQNQGDRVAYQAHLDQARRLQQQAQENAPAVGSLTDVTGPGSAVDFIQQGVGQGLSTTAPILGGAVAGRVAGPLAGRYVARGLGLRLAPEALGALETAAPFAGAASVAYPLEREEAIGSQFNDPVQMQHSAQERLDVANRKALRNLALESLVPGGIAAMGLKRIARRPAEALALELFGEGATEGIQELSGIHAEQELNPAVPADPRRIADAVALGAIGGGTIAVPSTGAAVLAQQAQDSAQPALAKTKEKLAYGLDRLDDIGGRLLNPRVDADLEGLAMGDSDPSLIGKTPEETAANFERRDTESVPKAARYAQEILNDPNIPDGIKEEVRSLNGDYRDAGAQAFVAATLLGSRGAQKVKQGAKELLNVVKEWTARGAEAVLDKTSPGKKKSLMEPKHQLKLQDIVFKYMKDAGKNDEKVRSQVPALANALADFLGREKELDAEDIPTLLRMKDALDFFNEPDEMLKEVGTTLKGLKVASPKKLFDSISTAEHDAKKADSFLYRSLTPETQETFSAPRLKEIARTIDAMGFEKDEKRFDKAVKEMAPLFGGEKNVRLAVEFYKDRNEQNLGFDKSRVSRIDTTKGLETGELGVESAPEETLFQNFDERRPFSPGTAGENEIERLGISNLGKETEGVIHERIPYTQHLKERNEPIGLAAEKLLSSLDKRIEDTDARIQDPKGNDDVDMLIGNSARLKAERGKLLDAKKVGGADLVKALSDYTVIRRKGVQEGASATDLSAYRYEKIKTAKNADRVVPTRVELYAQTKGGVRRAYALSAEAMWKHEAKDPEFEGMPYEQKARAAFAKAVAKLKQTKGVQHVTFTNSTVLDSNTGLRVGVISKEKLAVARERMENKKKRTQANREAIERAYGMRKKVDEFADLLVKEFKRDPNEQWVEDLETFIKEKKAALKENYKVKGTFIQNQAESLHIGNLEAALEAMRETLREDERTSGGEYKVVEGADGKKQRVFVPSDALLETERFEEEAETKDRKGDTVSREELERGVEDTRTRLAKDNIVAPKGRLESREVKQREELPVNNDLVAEIVRSISSSRGLYGALWSINYNNKIPVRYRSLAEHLMDRLSKENRQVAADLEVPIGDQKRMYMKGHYNEYEQRVMLNLLTAVEQGSPVNFARVILHEAVHAVSVATLEDPNSALAQHMHKLYEHAIRHAPKTELQEYGFTNVQEFIAEAFTSPEFQAVLAKLPPMSKNFSFKSLWENFLHLLAEGLGIAKDLRTTLLAEVLETGARVIQKNEESRKSPERAMKMASISGIKTKDQFLRSLEIFAEVFADLFGPNRERIAALLSGKEMSGPELAFRTMQMARDVTISNMHGYTLLSMLEAKNIQYKFVDNFDEAIQDELSDALNDRGVLFNAQQGEDKLITATQMKQVYDEILRTRGKDVKVIFDTYANVGGSGSYEQQKRLINIAITALNPVSVAWHESMHDFFAHLGTDKASRKAKQDLLDTANSPLIKARLQRLLAKHPAALKQLEDPEERLAYMYQFWAAGELELGTGARTWFQRITEFLAKLLGVATKAQRIGLLLTALHTGKLTEPSKMGEELAKEMYDTAYMRAERIAKPLTDGVNKLFTGATDRLRDTGVQALVDIADKFHREPGREQGGLPFLQRRSQMNGQWLNKLQDVLKGHDAKEIAQATAQLQAQLPTSPLALKVRALLDELHDYLTQAKVQRLAKPGQWEPIPKVPDYYPRVWDAQKIMNDHQGFVSLVMKEGNLTRPEAEEVYKTVTHGDGLTELSETEHHVGFTPYKLSSNARKLDFIDKSNAFKFIQFQKEDLVDVMSTYIYQAVHRAEYAKDFGNDGEWITDKLAQAKKQGATTEELETAGKAIQALEGTLGHDMNPQLRNIMGGLVTYENIVLLPFALFSSLIDPLGVALRSGDMKEAWAAFQRGMKDVAKRLVGKTPDDRDTELARTMGIIDELNMLENMGNLYNGMYMSKRLRNWNQKFFRWNGMESWNRSMRVAAMGAGMRFIIKNKNNSRYMKELGLEPADVVELPDGTLDVSSAKVQAALFKFVDGAVLRPNAAHRPVWGSDPHYMLVFHLKQFTYSFQNTILRRVKSELAEGVRAPMLILASYVPFMIASDFLRGGISGMTANWDLLDYMTHGVSRSGVLGVSQFGADAVADLAKGQVPGAGFIGPTFGHAVTVGKALTGAPGVEFTDVITRSLPASPLFKAIF